METPLILTIGDPSGIGPEVLLKSLSFVPHDFASNTIIYGEKIILENLATNLGLNLKFSEKPKEGFWTVKNFNLITNRDYKLGELSKACGEASFQYFNCAIEDCLNKKARGIITSPINKEAINIAGHNYIGHTDILEKKTQSLTVMSIFHPKIIVSHVTDHLPLKKALESITPDRVEEVILATHSASKKYLGLEPKIAVAGVNPHAGENGLLGKEEQEILFPVIQKLKKKNLQLFGPLPGDTIFFEALKGKYDVVIAMYHDQGFGPMKTLDMANSVNCTLGLPFIRTSPDHGTAFNIAPDFEADPSSMLAAWKLAVKLADSSPT